MALDGVEWHFAVWWCSVLSDGAGRHCFIKSEPHSQLTPTLASNSIEIFWSQCQIMFFCVCVLIGMEFQKPLTKHWLLPKLALVVVVIKVIKENTTPISAIFSINWCWVQSPKIAMPINAKNGIVCHWFIDLFAATFNDKLSVSWHCS